MAQSDTVDAPSTALDQQIIQAIDTGDQLRQAGLSHAAALAAARQLAQTLAQGRAAAKYGPDSAQATMATARAKTATDATVSIGAELARASIEPFDVPSGSAVIHGRVTDGAGAALVGATVSGVDASGAVHASAQTDTIGYFKLIFATEAAGSAQPAGAPDASAPTPAPAAGDVNRAVAGVSAIRLEVAQGGQVVVQERDLVTLAEGKAIYRELVKANGAT